MSLTVEKKLVISSGSTTCVPLQKEVDGLAFVCLEKWNRSLVKVFTGSALDLRQGKSKGSIDTPVYQKLVEARQNKANELLQEAITTEQEEKNDQGPKTRKVKPVRATSTHALKLTVDMDGHQCTMLLEGIGTMTIWLEFTEDNMNWFRDQVCGEETKPRRKRKARAAARGENPADQEDDEEEDE
ncbi:unnamed protein product [Symbiodinium sp. CCMP2592]|nr:unnamed protein product [Symbiodinium sp. CCMP2592]CAE7411716.1 unnamed protein product [Symbiodinium sp. CCMP2592]CAE7725823.1 unnamed protein product [Symbiodinium sp. CCMP2592]